ncbi:MAG: barstar family protein [Coriobacteriales bacterium]|nr:barstar family protein [Coriobacteriales bacterium]
MARPHKVVLREDDVADAAQAHAILARELDFPDYYGANLDALEDCLGDIATPTRIVLRRSQQEPKPWFDDLAHVVRDCAQRSCYLGCTIRN